MNQSNQTSQGKQPASRGFSHAKLVNLVLTSIFIAFILLLGLTPLGLIHLGFINVTLMCIPVVVGTLFLGLKTGIVLGFCFGTISALSAFGITGTPSSLVAALMAKSPLLVLLMCYLPRLAVPVVAHWVYKLISKGKAAYKRAVPFAAAAGSLTNTVLYLGLMLLFYVLMGIDSKEVLTLIGGTGLLAGGAEALAGALISTPVLAAMWSVQKRGQDSEGRDQGMA